MKFYFATVCVYTPTTNSVVDGYCDVDESLGNALSPSLFSGENYQTRYARLTTQDVGSSARIYETDDDKCGTIRFSYYFLFPTLVLYNTQTP